MFRIRATLCAANFDRGGQKLKRGKQTDVSVGKKANMRINDLIHSLADKNAASNLVPCIHMNVKDG